MNIVQPPSQAQPLDQFTIRWIGYGLVVIGAALPTLILFVGEQPAQVFALGSIIVQVGLLVLIERVPQAFLITLRNTTQQIINPILIIPVFSLVLAGVGARILQPAIPGLVAVAAAAVGMLVAVWTPRSAKVASPIVFGVFVGAFAAGLGWGSTTLLNRLFDSSPGQVFQTVIQDKRIRLGGRNGPYYDLILAPWGPVDHSETVGVSLRTYAQASIGGPMCVKLHPGALGMAWYQAGSC